MAEARPAAFFRSPMAHARIAGLDIAEAAAAPGVVAVITAQDFAGRMANGVDFETLTNSDGSDGDALADTVTTLAFDGLVRHG